MYKPRVINLNNTLAYRAKFLKYAKKSSSINIILLPLIKLYLILITRVLVTRIFDLIFYLYILFNLIILRYF